MSTMLHSWQTYSSFSAAYCLFTLSPSLTLFFSLSLTHSLSLFSLHSLTPFLIRSCHLRLRKDFRAHLSGRFIRTTCSSFHSRLAQRFQGSGKLAPLALSFSHTHANGNELKRLLVCSAARECARHGLLSEACHTRATHAARLDTALRTGAPAQVSSLTRRLNLWLVPNDAVADIEAAECPKMRTSIFSHVCRPAAG